MNNNYYGKKPLKEDPAKAANPNAKVNEMKSRFGAGYNYRFLEIDNLQREFYYQQMKKREKEGKRKNGNY